MIERPKCPKRPNRSESSVSDPCPMSETSEGSLDPGLSDAGRTSVGGWLSGSAEYARRAFEHAPRDRETLRVAVRELRSRGLTPVDIERALRLHPTAVADLLAEPAGE